MTNEIPFLYGQAVKVSHWQDRMQAFPIDHPDANTTGSSHYRTLGMTDDVYVPKTSTQALYESGLKIKSDGRQVHKNVINFVSYPKDKFKLKQKIFLEVTLPLTTTYREVYKAPKPLIKKKDCCAPVLDPLFNRIPKSDFEMLPSSSNKFMDDQLTMISQGRKKINFLRQMRNSTYLFDK